MRAPHKSPRKIIGFSMSPTLAIEVKKEAAGRGISLRRLFEELWTLYIEQEKTRKN